SLRRVVVDLVGGEQAEAVRAGESVEPVDPRLVVAGVEVAGGNVSQRREPAGEMRKDIGERTGDVARHGRAVEGDDVAGPGRHGEDMFEVARRQQDQLHPLGMFGEQGNVDVAGTLVLPAAVELAHAAGRDQPAQAAVGGTVDRIGEESQAFDRFYPAADNRL